MNSFYILFVDIILVLHKVTFTFLFLSTAYKINLVTRIQWKLGSCFRFVVEDMVAVKLFGFTFMVSNI
jgi:hypothetical protein